MRWLLGLLVLLLSVPGNAQAPRLTMIGVGAGMSCAEWLQDGRSDAAVEQWAFGFASAVAASAQAQRGGDPLGALDSTVIHAWMARFCEAQPQANLSLALVRMVYATTK